MARYSLEQFEKKYKNRRHISCGITFIDDTKITVMNSSYSQVISIIGSKEIKYIISK